MMHSCNAVVAYILLLHKAVAIVFVKYLSFLSAISDEYFAPMRLGLSSGFSLLSLLLGGCGLYVPLKDPIHENTRNKEGLSREGRLESNIIANIRCEVQNAIFESSRLGIVPWLSSWGTQVTLKLTWDEMSGVNPNVALINPLLAGQSFSLNLGGSASAHATRLETISFIWENEQLLSSATTDFRSRGALPDCGLLVDGPLIQSDLRIGEFIYDKASLAKTGIASTDAVTKYTTFQDDITFVASYGGNITPIWKLTRVTADTSGNLVSANRSSTGDVLITLGPLASKGKRPSLAEPAASQHLAGVTGGFTASQVVSQSR